MSYSQPHRPSGTLDFAVIGESFTLLFSRWQEYLLMGFISALLPALVMVIYFFGFMASAVFASPSSMPDASMFGMMLLMYPVIFLTLILAYPFYGGMCSYTLKLVRTGDASMSDFWGEWSRAGKWFVLGLLTYMWNFLGALACGVGQIVVLGLLFMAIPIMAHEDLSPSNAIRESYERLKPHFWAAIGLAFVASLVASVGVGACYVGIFLTLPLTYMIPAMVYAKWLAPIQPTPSASPYPRAGPEGYGEPPAGPEEAPGPPTGEPPKAE
ncbi:MAG: hypothetical protein IH944_05530 [Armatimonadetes bacterium]|nr:hypothetical protein [Armatimonadota bacterium]